MSENAMRNEGGPNIVGRELSPCLLLPTESAPHVFGRWNGCAKWRLKLFFCSRMSCSMSYQTVRPTTCPDVPIDPLIILMWLTVDQWSIQTTWGSEVPVSAVFGPYWADMCVRVLHANESKLRIRMFFLGKRRRRLVRTPPRNHRIRGFACQIWEEIN